MTNYVMGTLLAAGYLLVFWGFGALVPRKFQSGSPAVQCVTGFLLYFALFQLVAFPMKLYNRSLKELTLVWGAVLLVLALYVLLKKRDILAGSLKGIPGEKEKNGAILFMIVFSVLFAVFLGLNTNTISNYDSNNYIGLPAGSVYSNTLDRMSPLRGVVMDAPEHFYLLNTDTLQSAMVYLVLKIHPLMERKWSFTIAMVLLFEMAVYSCGMGLFRKNHGKAVVFSFFANLALFFSYSLAGVSHYFAYRTYEGKAVIAYFYTTVIFMLCLNIYQYKDEIWPWCALFLCGAGGIAFSNSALFIVPGMIALTLLPYLISEGLIKRDLKAWLRYFVVLIPSVCWMGIYLLV